MRRFLPALLASLLICAGCVNAEGTYQEQLNRRIETAITGATAGPTFSHGIYSYYKEPSIGRITSEKTSSIFTENGVKFVMNLNVSAIVNAKYYDSISTLSMPQGMDVLAESQGTFADYNGEVHPFDITLYKLDNGVFTYIKTDQLEFFSISNELQALQTAETMMRMARTVRVDSDAVISTYSSRQEIDYVRKRLELFQNVVPENGAIEELFEGNGNYAGVMDNYYGDNYDEITVSDQTIDSSMGDADDSIGGSLEDLDIDPELRQEAEAVAQQDETAVQEGTETSEEGSSDRG